MTGRGPPKKTGIKKPNKRTTQSPQKGGGSFASAIGSPDKRLKYHFVIYFNVESNKFILSTQAKLTMSDNLMDRNWDRNARMVEDTQFANEKDEVGVAVHYFLKAQQGKVRLGLLSDRCQIAIGLMLA